MAYTKTSDQTNSENVVAMAGTADLAKGSVGLDTQLPGSASTVSEGAAATGGIGAGNLFASDVDEQLFRFNSDDTPLMNLMLQAKHVTVDSPIVDHYMLDEPRASVKTTGSCGNDTAGSAAETVALPLSSADARVPQEFGTLLAKGVAGYAADGTTKTPGKELLLFVTGRNSSGMPIVRAVNGIKSNSTDLFTKVPAIPSGTTLVLLANALYETQKNVAPDMVVPQPEQIVLQKRGMNNVVSDYFDSQKKRIPFAQAVIAQQAIANFKVKCNRSLWAGRKGVLKVDTELGVQDVYFSEGIRWQFKRELQHEGKWTIEKIIALAKMFFTGEDVPSSALLLAGKNLLEEIQCIDYSQHPEIQITTKVNPVGWTVTNFHTVFGDIEVKREPTLDRIGWSNSGALIDPKRLVHYVRSKEHTFEERVEGHEATRSGIIKWDALALKGSCHIWIDGEGETGAVGVPIKMWSTANAMPNTGVSTGDVYYLLTDVTTSEGNPSSTVVRQSGTMWKATVTTSGGTTVISWMPFSGDYYA